MKIINYSYPFKFKLILVLVTVVSTLSDSAYASNKQLSETFSEHSTDNHLTIDYSDISQLLELAVFDVGRSYRQKTKSVKTNIGTRLKSSRNIYTALESNRFYFKVFREKQHRDRLVKIKNELQAVPDELPLKMFNRREQLAYWLNLYNITLLNELIDESSKSSLGSTLYGKDGILKRKLLKVEGVNLSLNDIQFNIVYPNYNNNPVLLYGFIQGIIGAPNIRTSAFTGDKINHQLDSNAEEFINSNRGTFKGRKGSVRVSTIYERNQMLFPDFEKDLKKHLLSFVIGDYEDWIKDAKSFKTDMKDMHIANIRAGTRNYSTSSSTNSAAMLDSAGYNNIAPDSVIAQTRGGGGAGSAGVGAIAPGLLGDSLLGATVSYGNYSADMVEMLARLKSNSRIRTGTVSVKRDAKKKREELID
ncbi:MAG: DUF547 domain-containing protein [Kangiellaceae bacterium]|nr:DUF547 domain-containing protein [Kangiellaceae bacterium]